MRQLSIYFLILVSVTYLTACTEDFNLTELQETAQRIVDDERFMDYWEGISFNVLSDRPGEMRYVLTSELYDSFDDLILQEKFNFLKHIANHIREVKMQYNGKIYCGEDYFCYVEKIELSTNFYTYSMAFKYNGIDETFKINGREIDNQNVYEELYTIWDEIVMEDLIIELESAEYVKSEEEIVIQGRTNLADGVELSIQLGPNDEYEKSPLSSQFAVVNDGKFTAVLGTNVRNDVGREHIPNGTFPIEVTLNSEWGEKKAKEIYKTYDFFDRSFNITNGTINAVAVNDNGFSVNDIDLGSISITNGFSKGEIEKRQMDFKMSRYEHLEFAQLDKNPSRFISSFVKYTGEIVQIIERNNETYIRLAVTKTSFGYSSNDIIYVEFNEYTDYVTGDIITVYGKVLGSHTYTSQAGWQITLPLIEAHIIE